MNELIKVSKALIFLDKIASSVENAVKTTSKMQRKDQTIGPQANTKIPDIVALGEGGSSGGSAGGSSSSSSGSSGPGPGYYAVENPVDRLLPGGINAY